ncbi:LacI family DNA-binding transcriptional regulator [Pseudoalteromonas sp. 5-MNA-CIBAN-0065]|uniref:LacI family DNA-binding transcriptional regulator n=1 Tax=Pseudoalteromonas sp. 5-MNA-CIBAN-0065 TaxID=3140421 RepID=UPI00332B7CE5
MRKSRYFSIKQIAAQSGVSKATVDRAVHQRGKVSAHTQRRIEQALIELAEQQNNVPISGRTFYIDVVMHAPNRFCQAVKEAIYAQLMTMAPFRIRPRFHLFEEISIEELCRQLIVLSKRSSHGIILKAPNDPIIIETVNILFEQGIPTVTLVTDLSSSKRILYSGMPNKLAGETAAYLMMNWLNERAPKRVLVVMSKGFFQGEQQRVMAFRKNMINKAKNVNVLISEGSYGMDTLVYKQINTLFTQFDEIHGVYSVGGGNNAILQAFAEQQRPLPIFIAHDLDRDNRILLAQHQIHAVLHHDLQQDVQCAFFALLQHHNVLPESDLPASKIDIITPFNIP